MVVNIISGGLHAASSSWRMLQRLRREELTLIDCPVANVIVRLCHPREAWAVGTWYTS